MTTITEDYVSFEIAKLLKEKGFNEPCECAYSEGGQYLLSCYKGIADRRIKNDETLNFSYSSTAPTLQMAMKWLREVHNIHIDIYSIWDAIHWLYQVFVVTPRTARNSYVDKILYTSYEQAVGAAIKYCLENLI